MTARSQTRARKRRWARQRFERPVALAAIVRSQTRVRPCQAREHPVEATGLSRRTIGVSCRGRNSSCTWPRDPHSEPPRRATRLSNAKLVDEIIRWK